MTYKKYILILIYWALVINARSLFNNLKLSFFFWRVIKMYFPLFIYNDWQYMEKMIIFCTSGSVDLALPLIAEVGSKGPYTINMSKINWTITMVLKCIRGFEACHVFLYLLVTVLNLIQIKQKTSNFNILPLFRPHVLILRS